MRIYIIGHDGITLCREAPTAVNEGEIVVASKEGLHAAPLNHGVDPTRRDVGEQPLQSGPIHRCAREPAVVITLRQAHPAFVPLAVDEGLASLALGLQRVEFLLEPLFGRFTSVDRTANP